MAEYARLYMKLYKEGQPKSDAAMVKGEVEVAEFLDQIEIEDWAWDLKRNKDSGKLSTTLQGSSGNGKEMGGIEPSRFTFSKRLDRATTTMLTHMASGTVLDAEVAFEEASDADFDLVLRLSKVRVAEYSMDGELDDKSADVKEKWVFDYHFIEFVYKPNDKRMGYMTVKLERKPGASKDDPESSGLVDLMKSFVKVAPETDQKKLEKTLKDEIGRHEKNKKDMKEKKGEEPGKTSG